VTPEDFADHLLKCRVTGAEQSRAFLESTPARCATTPVELARLSVRSGLLTRFQAEEIVNGRGRRLRVGDYVLLEVLGYGGMGLVYIARHIADSTRLALKLLGEQFKHDEGMRARFRLEARAGMRLNHPRLVKTLELGTHHDLYGDTDFMVMELVEGVTLLEGINFSSGYMKWDSACDVACQAAKGLAYLHEQGMVHRDVKPDNILIDVHGEAKLLDFGLTLADQSDDDDEFSLAMIFGQDCLGTADYIPPEQSLNSMTVDARADVYSLGCSLYASLTSQRPFPRPTRLATMQAHRTDPRPRVDAVNRDVPVELADIIERMMAVDPAQRPGTMDEIRSLLRPYRRRRNWAFEFHKVLANRRELKRILLDKSRLNALQAGRSTRLRAQSETDARPPQDLSRQNHAADDQ
jgi:serine/threonine-protein kinase